MGGSAQNYRCVVALGKARPVRDPEEKAAALLKLTEHIIPGRTQHARAANDRELSQTAVLAIDLNEVSAKASPPRSSFPPHRATCLEFSGRTDMCSEGYACSDPLNRGADPGSGPCLLIQMALSTLRSAPSEALAGCQLACTVFFVCSCEQPPYVGSWHFPSPEETV